MTAVSAQFVLNVIASGSSNLAKWAAYLPSGHSIRINEWLAAPATAQQHPLKIPSPSRGILRAPTYYERDGVLAIREFDGLLIYTNKGWYSSATGEVGFVARSFGSGHFITTFAEYDNGGVGAWYGGTPTEILQQAWADPSGSYTPETHPDYNDPVRNRQLYPQPIINEPGVLWPGWITPNVPSGHGYDGNTIDRQNGVAYYAIYGGSRKVYGCDLATGQWWTTAEHANAINTIAHVPGVGVVAGIPAYEKRLMVTTGAPGAGWTEICDLSGVEPFASNNGWGALLSFFDSTTGRYFLGGGKPGDNQVTAPIRYWTVQDLLDGTTGTLIEQPHTKWPSYPLHRWGHNNQPDGAVTAPAGAEVVSVNGKALTRFKTLDAVDNDAAKPRWAVLNCATGLYTHLNSTPVSNPPPLEGVAPDYLYQGAPSPYSGEYVGGFFIPIDEYGVVMCVIAGPSSSYEPPEIWLWKP